MTEYANADELLVGDGPETRDVPLPGGKAVKVRGLSRVEWFAAGKLGGNGENPDAFEAAMIAVGLVEPAMNRKQVEAWRNRPGSMAAIALVSDAVRELSGMGDGAAKSDVAGDGDDRAGA